MKALALVKASSGVTPIKNNGWNQCNHLLFSYNRSFLTEIIVEDKHSQITLKLLSIFYGMMIFL